ncbi:hypothetical protein [Actinoallomurus sp. NPDC052274]|uniref:hypothetical protein n=1 Tax=Actinoallomurus sp. NPDC052274 TaxID=3155420 RepID=UPI003436B4A4
MPAAVTFRTIAAAAAARRWVEMWRNHNDGEILSVREEQEKIAAVAGEFLGRIATAHRIGHLSVEKNPTGEYYKSVPKGAEFFLIKGAVRRGFAFKHGETYWMGYSVAGNGTETYAWPATPQEYAAFMAFFQ